MEAYRKVGPARLDGLAGRLHRPRSSSILLSGTLEGKMDAESIKQDSHCLWEAIVRFIKGCEHSDDPEYTLNCYNRLRENLTDYYESRRTDIDEAEIFFAQATLDAYDDLTVRKVIKTN